MIVPEHLKKTEELKQSERNIQSESQKCLVRAKYRTRQNVSTRSGQPLQSKKTSRIICGARFGHLTVLEQTEERKCGYVVWRCRCDCGNEYGAVSRELRSGRAVSCKEPSCEYYREALNKRYSREDFTGRRFGKLLVLGLAAEDITSPSGKPVQSRIKRDANGRVLWNCKCDCGNTVEATSSELKSGNRKSCGCLSRPPLYDWVGKRFGRLTVTAYDGKRNGYHYWKCLCDCGNETVVVQTSRTHLQLRMPRQVAERPPDFG